MLLRDITDTVVVVASCVACRHRVDADLVAVATAVTDAGLVARVKCDVLRPKNLFMT